eukprot:gene8447-11439_t
MQAALWICRPNALARRATAVPIRPMPMMPSRLPLIRRKVANVLARAGVSAGGHNDKRLRNILETWPRDELFQTPEDELLVLALGVLHLFDRPRVRLFARRDPFDRFISVLLFVPRERYDSGVREKAHVDQRPQFLAGGPAFGATAGHERLFGRKGNPDFERLALLRGSGFSHGDNAIARPVAATPHASLPAPSPIPVRPTPSLQYQRSRRC